MAAEEQDARTARIVGLGAATWRQFMADAAADPQVRKHYLAWAQGFMSGIILSRPPGVDVGLNLNPPTFGLTAQLQFRSDDVARTVGRFKRSAGRLAAIIGANPVGVYDCNYSHYRARHSGFV